MSTDMSKHMRFLSDFKTLVKATHGPVDADAEIDAAANIKDTLSQRYGTLVGISTPVS